MSDDDRATRVALLAGQGLALGLTMAWILIPASTVFLEAYGPERLPVTYIGAAFAGMLSSSALSAALRRQPLAHVATRILGATALLLIGAWALLRADAVWASFALLVLVPIGVPVGFVFIVGQAGALLDVRALKANYARVVAGFALGFMLGGLSGPLLLSVLGGTEQLLLAAAAAALLFLVILVVARRRYPAELSVIEHDDAAGIDEQQPTLRTLARYRYVVLIIAFQMLSAVESQWLDFQVFDRAAQRYTDSEDLARFISRFSAIAYGADILFLLVLAGWLLRRFGLRYGLTANSVGVLTVVIAIIVSTMLVGSTATFVFVLVVAARVTDLTLSDGSSRTSLSAAYGALPARLRGVAATTVEGLAVPVAIGISGVVLLVLQSAGSTRGLLLPMLTAAVVVAWLLTAILLYREYRMNLLANLRVRTLDFEDLTMEEESGRIAIDRLVRSSDERDVRLGLEILAKEQHPELLEQLQRLTMDERVRVRTDALERLLELAPELAATAARDGLRDASPDVRAASIRVLGSVREPSDRPAIAAFVDDPDDGVKVAVAFALTRIDSGVETTEIVAAVTTLARSVAVSDRVLAARMIGACSVGHRPDPEVLRVLLNDPAPDVANAALDAIEWSADLDLLTDVIAHLENRWTTGAAVKALIRLGEPGLAVVDEQLRTRDDASHTRVVLVRVARDIGGPHAPAILRSYVSDVDRDVGLAAMTALAALEPDTAAAQTELEALAPNVARDDLEYATHVLRARAALEEVPSAAAVRAALGDELALLQRRAFAWLSIRHGAEALQRIELQLAQPVPATHALALEWLDVTLSGSIRAVVALLEPRLSDRERFDALTRSFPLATTSVTEILIDLVRDPADRWRRPWISACALYAASGIRDTDRAAIVAAAGDAPASISDDEDGIWAETLAYIRNEHVAL